MRLSEIQSCGGYITVYDEVLPRTFCDNIIAKFERNEDDVQRLTTLKGVRNFTEVNISEHWHNEHETMVHCIKEVVRAYINVHGIIYDVQYPRQFGYEQFRMKRYLPNGIDEFSHHTDVGSYASARRFLACQWYLNTVVQGGETGFGQKPNEPTLIVPAVSGRLLMFPPLWTHPHWGSKVISGPKYIITGYLHYI